jgi:hypothetical protein
VPAAAAAYPLQELGLDNEIVAMACQAAEILMIMRQVGDQECRALLAVDQRPAVLQLAECLMCGNLCYGEADC